VESVVRHAAPCRAAPDPAAARQRQQADWACGDYAVIGTTFQIVGETLAEAADVRAGERVLDVAAGSGNATLAAARRFAHVTSTDVVPALLDTGRERARADALPVTFRVADAEALPFADASFDIVLSMFGATYARDAMAAAREMRRVLRPGGRIALACWTPGGFVGRVLRVLAAHAPLPAGLRSPPLGGTRADLARIFGVSPAQIHGRCRRFHFRYRSAAHWVQMFRDFHGPMHRVFAALEAPHQQALERDLTALLDRANTAGPSSLVVPATYLEAVIHPGIFDGPSLLAQPD
jgi:SAM-dependent methyltransferase